MHAVPLAGHDFYRPKRSMPPRDIDLSAALLIESHIPHDSRRQAISRAPFRRRAVVNYFKSLLARHADDDGALLSQSPSALARTAFAR